MNREFWIRTADSHLKTSVISWCMVFGADSSSIHWKNIIEEDENKKSIIEGFRQIILDTNNLDQISWDTYWKSIIGFRNEFIAHRLIDNKDTVPYLSIALNIALKYDIWIRKVIEPDIFESPTLEQSYNNYLKNIEETLKLTLHSRTQFEV